MSSYEAIYIFCIAVLITLLFNIRDIIENNYHRTKTLVENTIIAGSKAVTSGIIVILGYNAMQELAVTLSVFGINIPLVDNVALFVSVVVVLFSDELIFRVKSKLKGDLK